jgi:Ca2+-binding EF-hand superfamily protein
MGRAEFIGALRRLGVTDPVFHERCFAVADESGDGTVDFQEFFDTIFVVLHGSAEQIAEFEFSMWAGRGSNHMSPKQFEDLYAAGCRMDANRSSVESVVRMEAQSAFRRADAESNCLIDRAEFARIFPTIPSPLTVLSQTLRHNHN